MKKRFKWLKNTALFFLVFIYIITPLNVAASGSATNTGSGSIVTSLYAGGGYKEISGSSRDTRGNYAIAVKGDGSVWAWGANNVGQLGNGTLVSEKKPILVAGLGDIVSVAAGDGFSLALDKDGNIWSWGLTKYALWYNDPVSQYIQNRPAKLINLSDVSAISAGKGFAMALKKDGTVWTWGSSASGQVYGSYDSYVSEPRQVRGLENVIRISAGSEHAMALKSDGTVWVWGNNQCRQLADGTNVSKWEPSKVANLPFIKEIAAGGEFNAALTKDNEVYTWGSNVAGQCAHGTVGTLVGVGKINNFSGVMRISAGNDHMMAIKNDGTVWSWGSNSLGQLGEGTANVVSIPQKMSTLSNIVNVVGGYYRSYAVDADRSVWAFGYNADGALGDGTDILRQSPVKLEEFSLMTPQILSPASIMILGSNSLKIPASGEVYVDYIDLIKDGCGNVIDDDKATWSLIDNDNSGVGISTSGRLTVSKDAFPGDITIKAEYSGVSAIYKVALGRKDPEVSTIVIEGEAQLALPETTSSNGVNSISSLYVLSAYNQYGQRMNAGLSNITWAAESSEGYIDQYGNLNISSSQLNDNVVISASYGGKKTYKNISITRDDPRAKVIEIKPSKDVLKFPGVTAECKLDALVYDQYGQPLDVSEIVWEVAAPKPAGVSVDNNGLVSITEGAITGTAVIKASYGSISKTLNLSIKNMPDSDYMSSTNISDFDIQLHSFFSDYPSVIFSKHGSYGTKIYGENYYQEEIWLWLEQDEDGQYYYKYSTESIHFPVDSRMYPFTPVLQQMGKIVLKVYSNEKPSYNEFSGANLNVYNNTDLELCINTYNDDPYFPRMRVRPLSGKVTIGDSNVSWQYENASYQTAIDAMHINNNMFTQIDKKDYMKFGNTQGGIAGNIIYPYYQSKTTQILDYDNQALLRTYGIYPGSTITYSPDGKYIRVFSSGSMQVVDAASGNVLRTINGIVADTDSYSSPRYVVMKDEFKIKVWDTNTGELVKTLGNGNDMVNQDIIMSPDEKTLVTYSPVADIRIWDIQTGEEVKSIDLAYETTGVLTTDLMFSPDGSKLVGFDNRNYIKVWDVATGTQLYSTHAAYTISSIHCSPDSSKLAVRRSNGEILMLNLATGAALYTTKETSGYDTQLSFSQDNRYYAITNSAGISIRNTSDGSLVRTISGINRYYQTSKAEFSPDGSMILLTAYDNTNWSHIGVWAVETGQVIRRIDKSSPAIDIFAISPDSQSIVYINQNGAKSFGLNDGTLKQTWTPVSKPIYNILAKKMAVISGRDVTVIDTASGAAVRTISGTATAMYALISDDGSKMVVFYAGGVIKVIRISDGTVISNVTGATSNFNISRNGQYLVYEKNKTLYVHNTSTNSLVTQLGNTDTLRNVFISDDASKVITYTQNFDLKLWNVSTNSVVAQFKPNNSLNTLVIDTEANMAAIAVKDKNVQLWKLSEPYGLLTISGTVGNVSDVLLIESGTKLLTMDQQGISTWDIASASNQAAPPAEPMVSIEGMNLQASGIVGEPIQTSAKVAADNIIKRVTVYINGEPKVDLTEQSCVGGTVGYRGYSEWVNSRSLDISLKLDTTYWQPGAYSLYWEAEDSIGNITRSSTTEFPIKGFVYDQDRIFIKNGGTAAINAAYYPDNVSGDISWINPNLHLLSLTGTGSSISVNAIWREMLLYWPLYIRATIPGMSQSEIERSKGVRAEIYEDIANTLSQESVVLLATSNPVEIPATFSHDMSQLKLKSSNENVARVNLDLLSGNPKVMVTPLGIGETVISMTALDGRVFSSVPVKVLDNYVIEEITLDEVSLTLNKGDARVLTATVKPQYVPASSIHWTSSNPSVAAVTAAGKVVAIAPGTASITAASEDGTVSAACVVQVKAPADYIDISIYQKTITVGETTSLKAIVYPYGSDSNVIWTSSKESVATVVNGVVTAVSHGTAIITAATDDGNKTVTSEITVIAAPKPGDCNADGIIDIDDLVILSLAYGASSNDGSGRYNVRADLNKDETVDMLDLSILSSNYNK